MIADLHINKILENISDSRGSHDVSDHYVCYFSKFANLFFDFLCEWTNHDDNTLPA
jgi:hypothetical protein